MPHMSNMPFMLVSVVLFMFFMMWIINVWFKSKKEKFKSKKSYKNGSNNWPL